MTQDKIVSIWLLTGVSLFFGVATGLINSAAPQAVQALHLSSVALGLVGAGVPLGYTASCLLCGRYFGGLPAKRVLICGSIFSALSVSLMALTRNSYILVLAQILFGLASGAMWPFCSAWLLEFESPAIPKERILRHYNVSWTAGTASGMYLGGQLCTSTWVFETFYVSAAASMIVLILTALAHEPRTHGDLPTFPSDPATGPHADSVRASAITPHRVALATLIAAVLFNFTSIGTKTVMAVNYAELNKNLGSGADRMGLLMAVGILSQLAAFTVGKWYEPLLGLRRVYVVGALTLVGVNWIYATSAWLPILIVSEAAMGFVLAAAFQCAILAFTARSANPRAGTTMLEASVGAAGLAPLAAGALTESLKRSGSDVMLALRAPFYATIAFIVIALIAQLLLVPTEKSQRQLMLENA